MSVEDILGISTVNGMGAGTVAQLADTGNPITVAVLVAAVTIVITGFVTRFATSKR